MSATPTIAFEHTAGGVLLAKLGVVVVGEAMPHGADWVWRVRLPEVPPHWRPARRRDDACQALTRIALDWVEAAGLASALAAEGAIRSWRQDREKALANG